MSSESGGRRQADFWVNLVSLQSRGLSYLKEFRPNFTVLTLGRRKFDSLKQVLFSFSSTVILKFDLVKRWFAKSVIKSIMKSGNKPLSILYISIARILKFL